MAVARNESFKKAAIELRIAQPALSRQISVLEHELKCQLFTRHTRGSLPTEEGRLLMEEAERILHLTDQARKKLLFRQGSVSGLVGVGLAPTLAEWIAPELTERLRASHPEVRLSFHEGLSPRLRQLLITGGVDVAVLSSNTDPTHLVLGHDFSEPISLVGPASDPIFENDAVPLTLAELIDFPIIVAGIAKEGIRAIVDRALAEADLSLRNVVAEVETVFMARPMVMRELGYAISIGSAAEAAVRAGLLATRPIQGLRLERLVARSAEHSPSRAVLEVSKEMSGILCERFPRKRGRS